MRKIMSIHVKDMIDNMNNAEKFVEGKDYDGFVKDEVTNYAVVRCLEIIGEAAKKVSKDICEKYKDIRWSEMAKTRDLIIHHYDIVDLSRVWKIIKDDIPVEKPKLKKLYTDILKEELTK